MTNHYGGQVSITATPTGINNTTGLRTITIRSDAGNATVIIGNGSGQTGFLYADEAKTFYNMRPSDIYLSGTAGNVVYWDGNA